MVKTKQTTVARWLLGALLTLVATASLGLVAAPAQAQSLTQFQFNGFEGGQVTSWTLAAVGGAGNNAYIESGVNPRSGISNGVLVAQHPGSAGVSRNVSLASLNGLTCYMSGYVQVSRGWIVVYTKHPTTGLVLHSRIYDFTSSTGGPYVEVRTPTFVVNTANLLSFNYVVDLGAANGQSAWARVDDTSLTCHL